jgi:ribosomal protein S27E
MGLKFTPTPEKNNNSDIESDLSDFFRKLRLKEYFYDEPNVTESVVKNKSTFMPPTDRNSTLEDFITTTKTACSRIASDKNKITHNITPEQRNALSSLSKDKSIVIKEADKGGGIVIMNTNFYKNKIVEMLQNNEFYSENPRASMQNVFNKIKKLVKENDKMLKQEIDYVLNFYSKTSVFYGLPKIHKSKIVSEACDKYNNPEYIEIDDPEDLEFRPIVAGSNSETSRLSKLLDNLLKPFLTKVPSFIKDSVDFLKYIPPMVPKNTLLVSFDVVNLYTNIPHKLGIEAVNYWLDKHPNLLHSRFNKGFIVNALQLILENNSFTFNEKQYQQVKGTAMGTNVAPTYATLVLGYLEVKLHEQIRQEKGIDMANYIRTHWKRFIDDCFIFWSKSVDELNYFTALLNNLNENINFKIQLSDEKLPFLDVMIIKQNTCIQTDIYYKPTDSKLYLNFNSCHPKHSKTNIPFTLAKRICTVVSDKVILNKRLTELEDALLKRKYPKQLIAVGIRKAISIPRTQLLNHTSKENESIIPYISTYNPQNKELFSVIHNNMQILNTDNRMKEILTKHKITKCKRQLPNIKRILSRSLYTEESQHATVTKCNNPRCGLCGYIIEGESFNFNGKVFYVKQSMNCNVENVLYVLRCNGCGEYYIGQTGGKLRLRRNVHEQQMRDPSTRQMPLSKHLDECSVNEPKFSIFPFYKFHHDDVSARLAKEKTFIQYFSPKLNS